MEGKSRVVKCTGCLWKILLAHIYYLLIYLHHIYLFNSVISAKLTDSSAVPRTNNKHLFYLRIDRHRHCRYHFMINELVLFGKHYKAVKHQYPAELICVKNVYFLIVAFFRIKLFFYTNGEINIVRMFLSKPKIHKMYLLSMNLPLRLCCLSQDPPYL